MQWTAEYLTAHVGDVEVRHKRSRSHAHPDFRAATLAEMFATDRARVADLIAMMTSGRADVLFTGDEHFLIRRRDGLETRSDELRALVDDVELPALVPADRLYTVWAWFSGAGVRTWLHYDNNGCHNHNAQLTGEKRCWLFAPDQVAHLAPFPLGGGNPAYNCSRLDADAPLPDALAGYEATLHSAATSCSFPRGGLHNGSSRTTARSTATSTSGGGRRTPRTTRSRGASTCSISSRRPASTRAPTIRRPRSRAASISSRSAERARPARRRRASPPAARRAGDSPTSPRPTSCPPRRPSRRR